MTFNRSCAFTCLANLLESFEINVEDRDIIITAGIPYCFYQNDNYYFAGSQLQTKQYFDLYLNPIGFDFIVKKVSKADISDYLQSSKDVMIGLKLRTNGKHAVIYKGIKDNKYIFFNVKHIDEEALDYYSFTETELLSLVDDFIYPAYIEKIVPKQPDIAEASKSPLYFTKYKIELTNIFSSSPKKCTLISERDRLFAPLLLDFLTMTELIKRADIHNKLLQLRKQYMISIKPESCREEIDTELLKDCLNEIDRMIIDNNQYIYR